MPFKIERRRNGLRARKMVRFSFPELSGNRYENQNEMRTKTNEPTERDAAVFIGFILHSGMVLISIIDSFGNKTGTIYTALSDNLVFLYIHRKKTLSEIVSISTLSDTIFCYKIKKICYMWNLFHTFSWEFSYDSPANIFLGSRIPK